MAYAKGSEYSRSSSPYKRYGRSISRSSSKSRSRSRSRSSDVENPGNNLYVTGLSPRITKRDLEDHFARMGKVVDVHLVVDPWSRESRGFGFVTMSTVEEADCCIKYLDRSVLEGRVITVEKARRRRGRTPTPGRYLGLKTGRGRRRSTSYSPRRSPSYSPRRRRTPSYSPRRHRTPGYSPRRRRTHTPYSRRRSPRYWSDRSMSRSYSPYDRSHGSYSPPYRSYLRRRSYSPYRGLQRSVPRSHSPYSLSPVYRRDQSYSPYDSRDYYGRTRYRSVSQHQSRRSYSRSHSPQQRSSSYCRSVSPGRRSRSYSLSISPRPRRCGKHTYTSKQGYSRDSRSSQSVSCSRSVSASSRDVSRSVAPRSASGSS